MWPLIIGAGIVAAGLAWWKKDEKKAQTASNAGYKAGDVLMVRTAGLGLPRAMTDVNAELVSPPELLPVRVYGTTGNLESGIFGRIATLGGLAYPQFWDATDVTFFPKDVDGYARDSSTRRQTKA